MCLLSPTSLERATGARTGYAVDHDNQDRSGIMKMNVGNAERALRIVVGLVLIALAIADIGTPWTWIGVVPLATGLFRFCPVYALFGRNHGPKQP
jgi:hypothetical protein